MNLFGKKKKKSKENKNEQKVNEAIQKLKESLEQITKRENHLNAQIEETRNHARVKLQKGDRQGATLEIRREKLMRNEILNNFSKKLNLDATILALESASSNKVVLEAVKQSKQALHDMMKESNVDDYAEIMDETNEMMMNVNEISFNVVPIIFGRIVS